MPNEQHALTNHFNRMADRQELDYQIRKAQKAIPLDSIGRKYLDACAHLLDLHTQREALG